MASKQKVSQSRLSRRRMKSPRSPKQAGPVSTGMADLLKDIDASMEQRAKDRRQELEEHHWSRVRKTELDIRKVVRLKRRYSIEHRATRIKRLAELLKRRTEIENLILSRMQDLNDTYSSVSHDLQVLLDTSLSRLR